MNPDFCQADLHSKSRKAGELRICFVWSKVELLRDESMDMYGP